MKGHGPTVVIAVDEHVRWFRMRKHAQCVAAAIPESLPSRIRMVGPGCGAGGGTRARVGASIRLLGGLPGELLPAANTCWRAATRCGKQMRIVRINGRIDIIATYQTYPKLTDAPPAPPRQP